MVQRSSGLVKFFAILTNVMYFGMLAATAFVVVVLPLVKAFAQPGPSWHVSLGVSVVDPSDRIVSTSWGDLSLDTSTTGKLRVPLANIPWKIFAIFWVHMAVALGIVLRFLFHLRRIAHRVRDGAPFDEQNALRMRSLGVLLIVLTLFTKVAQVTMFFGMSDLGADRSVTLGQDFSITFDELFAPLVLIVLAEVFRRGAELEQDQALVV